jgi:dipeptidyl aminopeptidase/acylaminoacyl peptidase
VFTAVLGSGSGFNLWRLPMNTNGTMAGPLEPLTAGGGRDLDPSFSPDGKLLAYSVIGWNSDVMCLRVDPSEGKLLGEPKVLLSSSREDTRAVLSPDEKWVAFTSDREGQMNLWVAEFNATEGTAGPPWRVTSGPGGDYQVQWVPPSGEQLMFFSRRSGNDDIWTVYLDEKKRAKGPPVQLTTQPDRDVNPFVSPDGKHIAWQTDRSGGNELWVMNPDGSGQRPFSTLKGGGHFNPWMDSDSVSWARRRVFLDGREPQVFMGMGGAHTSFSPGNRFVLENDHSSLYLGAVNTNTTWKTIPAVFKFSEPNVGMDYSVWSPSGKWALLDRTTPVGGDIMLLRNPE